MTFHQAKLTKPMVNSQPANQSIPRSLRRRLPLPHASAFQCSSDMMPSCDLNPAALLVPL